MNITFKLPFRMKKLSLLFVISIFLFSAFPQTVSGQCSEIQATCYGNFDINDNNPGDYYLVYLRVVTLCPTTSNWSYVGQFFSIGSKDYNGKQTSPVGVPDQETYYFYEIQLNVVKYVSGIPVTNRTGSSYASRSSTSLTAYNDIDINF